MTEQREGNDRDRLAELLAAPFDPAEVRFKPQSVSGNRALAIAYVDARVVMQRLDDVLGLGGWQTTYREAKAGVICTLRVRIGDEWITHEDVGSPSEQPDEGDQLKAAVSDSLKRAAVHLGVARYLYRLPAVWVDYDPQKKQIVSPPALPTWALPSLSIREGVQLYEDRLVRQGRCQPGELTDHVTVALEGEFPGPISSWPEAARRPARQACAEFARLHGRAG
jgi:hypothetical protein